MHPAVTDFVGQYATREDLSVLDLGGRDLNGSTRHLFPNANPYHVLDIVEAPGVDFVADAADWRGGSGYDLVLSTETFEHTRRWPEIIRSAWAALRPGGWFIFTCAGPGRPTHSGVAPQWELIGDEWYKNVSPEEIREVLELQGWTDIEVRLNGTDTQGKAIRPEEVVIPRSLFSTAVPDNDPYQDKPNEVVFGEITLSRTGSVPPGDEVPS